MACWREVRPTRSARDNPYRVVRYILGLSYWSCDEFKIGRLTLRGHSDQNRMFGTLV